MHLEIRRLLTNVDGAPVRISSTKFARLWDPPISVKMAVLHMRDLLLFPPEGYEVRELETERVTIEIRRVDHDH